MVGGVERSQGTDKRDKQSAESNIKKACNGTKTEEGVQRQLFFPLSDNYISHYF